ncbi:MAG: AbrB/MazE/SpoVT family DNA-binding domain-containing protein [Nitrososphaerales archaeon]
MTTEVLIGKVMRKGQVTIPAQFRKAHRIEEGSRVEFRNSDQGLLLKPLPSLEDLAGVDLDKVTYNKAVKTLNKMRSEDRY